MTLLHLPSWSLNPNSAPPVSEQPPRVMLFDGESRLSDSVSAALLSAGYELQVQSTPRRVATVVASYAPDLILVDVQVRDGGFELCGELRATEYGRQVPIVLLTTEPVEEQLVTRGLLCGADDFLHLSDRIAEFQARVRVQLRHKRDRDRLRRVRAERDNFRREAVLDVLTGLPNRRAIGGQIQEALAAADPFATVFVDVDNFKSINDTFGHDVGDRVLKRVAETLSSGLRPLDHCGRWGGEEFLIVLRDVSPEQAVALTEQHRARLESIRGEELGARPSITASFGVAAFDPNRPDDDEESLCQRADTALYEAKRSGKNRVTLAAPTDPRRSGVSLRVEPVDLEQGASARAMLEGALLKELSSGRAGLPLLPEAAAEAMRLAEDPRTDIGRIAKLIERDPPLAARFVAIASSAIYSRGVKPSSTQVALVRIGLAAARDLLLQAVYERSNQELPVFRAEVTRSFERSVKSGIAARMLARELRVAHDYAYLYGLLHDIGESRVYRILARMPLAFEHAEFAHELVAKHHQRAGADVACAWHLPQDIVEVCANHHGAVETASQQVKIVMGADALNRICERPLEEITNGEELAVLQALGLSGPRATDLVERVRRAHEDAERPVEE